METSCAIQALSTLLTHPQDMSGEVGTTTNSDEVISNNESIETVILPNSDGRIRREKLSLKRLIESKMPLEMTLEVRPQ